MEDHLKFDKIIPTGEKEFAYQQENISIDQAFTIVGHMPWKGGAKEYLNDEKDRVSKYELEIKKFTGNSFEVTLYKTLKDKVGQRRAKGYATLREGYTRVFDFAEFVNAIFKNQWVFPFTDDEHYPAEIQEQMKKAYKP